MENLPYLPIPKLTKFGRHCIDQQGKWYCYSAEYCTWDGLYGFLCGGIGDSPEEAYKDWLESYVSDRYLGDEE